jgi:hypothetical protein
MLMKSFQHSSRGSVLITVLAMMVFLMAVSGSILSIVSHEYMMSKRSVAWNQSLSTAETGIELGWNEINKLTAINTNGVFMAGSNWTTTSSGIWVSSPQTLTSVVGSEAPTTYVVTVNTNDWSIVATGTATSSLMSQNVSRSVKVTVNPTTPFEWAILAKGLITFNGTPLVDSWNSNQDGTYDSAVNQRSNGTVGTDGALIAAGGLEIWGSMVTGPDGTVSSTAQFEMLSNEYCRGDPTNTISNGLEVYIPSVGEPWAKGASGVATATDPITVAGTVSYEMGDITSDLTIQGSGTVILYVDSIDQSGNDVININPTAGQDLNVIIYSKNSIDLTGNGIVNGTGQAENLLIYGLPTCTSVKVTGTSAFVGAIYAPDADADLGGTQDYFGAVICKSMHFHGTGDFHYDEALDTVGQIVGFSLVAWHEQ